MHTRDLSGAFIAMLESVGALKSGHFQLASGRHSDRYVEKFDLLRRPGETQVACSYLIELLGDMANVELVVGPTTGGILLAFEIARQLGLPAAYAERVSEGADERSFKRGARIEPGTIALVVDDVLTTGGSIRETLKALDRCGARVRAIAVLVDRSGGSVAFDAPLVPLARLSIDSWAPDACPLCREGIPLVKPGTTSHPPA